MSDSVCLDFLQRREKIIPENTINRRTFLCLGVKAAVGLLALQAVPAWAGKEKRSLSFYHTHTGEYLDVTYSRSGVYDPLALVQVNHYLRDFRTEEEHIIDPGVLDILWQIQQEMGCRGIYEVISGYRSPATNKVLRKKSKGVAKRSLHMLGQAIDIRLPGQKTCQIRDCAIGLKCGGVGYYAKSDFVHVDTGRVRTW